MGFRAWIKGAWHYGIALRVVTRGRKKGQVEFKVPDAGRGSRVYKVPPEALCCATCARVPLHAANVAGGGVSFTDPVQRKGKK
ncbi:MAG: hypothetical protein V3S01_07085 [Dehalococcoidia bacterium]